MNLNNIEFAVKQMKLEPSPTGGHNILISMVSVYKDGKYLKHAKLNNELLKALAEKGTVKVDVNLDKLEEMINKNKSLPLLIKTLDLTLAPTDNDIIAYFENTKMPDTPIRVNEFSIIDRPPDYVETHLTRIKSYGQHSPLGKNYLSHLTELFSALNAQGWTG